MENTTLTGTLGRDPELKYLPDGTPACEFSLAVRNYKGDTKWVRVSIFGKQAENANQYLRKGKKAAVAGEYIFDTETGGPRTWQKRDGTTGTGFEFRGSSVEFLSGWNEEPQAVSNGSASEEDDIPF